MCELITALTIGSTLLGAAGQIQSAQAQSSAAKYSAQIGEMNATLADRRARDAVARGQEEENKKRLEVGKIRGQQMAGMAANGVDLSFGSPLDTMIDTATAGELDALTIRTNSYREAYEHQVDAVNKRAGAAMQKASAGNAMTGGYLSAGGTLLTGGGKAYQSYGKVK